MTQPLNILFLMTDQHRADHVGFLNPAKLPTPNIDRIAEGVGFANCISVNPICTPARTALLTGKYTHQIGTLSMSGDLSRQHPTYLQALQAAGYWTAGVGKFHWLQGWPWGTERGRGHNLVALQDEVKKYGLDYVWEVAGKQLAMTNYCDYCAHLERRGILDEYRDHVASRGPNSMDPERTSWSGEPWPFAEEDYVDVVTGKEILKAIDARPRNQPFCLFGSFCGPHKPYDPPASFLETIAPDSADDFIAAGDPMDETLKERMCRVRRAYRAMIATIDHQIGIILDKLESDGLLENTVVLFTADHGEMLGDHSRMSKMQPWRQSVTVPAAVRHPQYLNRATVTEPIELTDLTATMLEVAGLDPKEALSKPWPAFHDRVPCRSLLPVVRGEQTAVRDFAFSECAGNWQMIQTRQWKYIRHLNHSLDGVGREELYNLGNDPDELENVVAAPELGKILAEMRTRRERVMDATPPAQTRWAAFG